MATNRRKCRRPSEEIVGRPFQELVGEQPNQWRVNLWQGCRARKGGLFCGWCMLTIGVAVTSPCCARRAMRRAICFFAIFEGHFCKEHAGDQRSGPEGWIFFYLVFGVWAASHTRRMGGSPFQFRFPYLNVCAGALTVK